MKLKTFVHFLIFIGENYIGEMDFFTTCMCKYHNMFILEKWYLNYSKIDWFSDIKSDFLSIKSE